MNLMQYDAHYPDGFVLTRPHHTLVIPDHELICLGFEEALNRGLDAQYGAEPSDTTNHYLEVYDCSPDEFTAIIAVATAKMHAPQVLVVSMIGGAA